MAYSGTFFVSFDDGSLRNRVHLQSEDDVVSRLVEDVFHVQDYFLSEGMLEQRPRLRQAYLIGSLPMSDESPPRSEYPLLCGRWRAEDYVRTVTPDWVSARLINDFEVQYTRSLWGDHLPVSGLLDIVFNKYASHLLL